MQLDVVKKDAGGRGDRRSRLHPSLGHNRLRIPISGPILTQDLCNLPGFPEHPRVRELDALTTIAALVVACWRDHMPRLIKGQKLTHEQREMVLAAFIHRDTVEYPWIRGEGDIPNGPFARQTDEDWIRSHSFWFADDGKQLENRNEVSQFPFPPRFI
jgi:hypothetical protein